MRSKRVAQACDMTPGRSAVPGRTRQTLQAHTALSLGVLGAVVAVRAQ
jgi:hypothetical protein